MKTLGKMTVRCFGPVLWLVLGLVAIGCDSSVAGGGAFVDEDVEDDTYQDLDGSNFNFSLLDGSDDDSNLQNGDGSWGDPNSDGRSDDDSICPQLVYYADADQDGYGDYDDFKLLCDTVQPPPGFVLEQPEGFDCDDEDFEIHPEAQELCDQKDNNCTGIVDDIESSICDNTNYFGSCIGKGACSGGTMICDAPWAEPESCDGMDNDCDDDIDEDFPTLGQDCIEGAGECAAQGTVVCSEDQQMAICAASPGAASEEVCDGLDNDCDELIDEDLTITQPCGITDAGECTIGVEVDHCEEGSYIGWTGCDAVLPTSENCDGLDNDCDGETDEDFEELDEACVVGVGSCINPGLYVCSEDGQTVVCDGLSGDPDAEICDGIDNDCDSMIDEGITLEQSCGVTDLGECTLGTEFNLCEDGSYSGWVGCDAVLPSSESCDGIDNDCDGQVDEDLEVKQSCGLTDIGVCTVGVESKFCVNGEYTGWTGCDVVLPSDETCDGLDNDCDGEADEDFVGLGQPCIAGTGGCQESGIYVCSDNGMSFVCNAAPGNPAPEVCDGIDNDCDELVDEGLDMEQICGPSATGECSLGIEHRYCLDGAYTEWVGCSAVLPVPELCDALDNDCDGDADEDFEDLGSPCWDGIGVCEGLGEFVCTEDGLSTICNAVPGEPAPEICDGLDNNCDGETDEDFPLLDELCNTGVGSCSNQGSYICSEDGQTVICDGQPGEPDAEACDGIDNDCDSLIDEGITLEQPCGITGLGECTLGTEFNLCEDGSYSGWVGCDAVLPSSESCDGLDNDCDGQVDENLEVEQSCGLTDIGVCTLGVESKFCVNGEYTGWTGCDVVLPSDETCDGLDNDCDGEADEDFVSLGQPCIAGTGGCQESGIYVCSDDGMSFVCNAVPGNPAPEVCDGIDNDCDEFVDEGLDMEQTCGPSATGECSLGIEHRYCLDGAYTEWVGCSAVLPVPELCDALDNDCDGDADEDFEDLGSPCWDGIGVCEGLGEFVCTEDGLSTICNAVPGEPAPEVCDGLDNNCDGETDEDFPLLDELCNTGVGSCSNQGSYICSEDGQTVICDGQPGEPDAEACDGIDNDCDSLIDEGITLEQPCGITGLGECTLGTEFNLCEDGSYSGWVGCDAALPSSESCDGLDNDCDGQVDEDLEVEQPCGVNDIGVCTVGVESKFCINGQYSPWLTCDAILPSDEICDGLDNNCDGETDEDFPLLDELCNTGVGSCSNQGSYICSEDGQAVICDGQPGEPDVETCDGIDNDCDSMIDEGITLEQPCGVTGLGECTLGTEFNLCEDGSYSGWVGCDAVLPSSESCDGLDNDCDGQVDEDLEVEQSCGLTDIGVCTLGVESKYCVNGEYTGWTGCDVVLPSDETCDGLDNDCDGEADEDFVSLGQPCIAGTGGCQESGIYVCSDDGMSFVCNAVPGNPAPEVCDGIDNDCDELVDEGLDMEQTCGPSATGECSLGIEHRYCLDGAYTEWVGCSAVLPVPEFCDGLDNDCDGDADEDFEDLGSPCWDGIGACEGLGGFVCTEDGLSTICNAVAGEPAPEICDGLDNNCDGETDEDFPLLDELCNTGVGSCSNQGSYICSEDGQTVICDGQPGEPVVETCDGIDNDCDSLIDEGITLEQPCGTGLGECTLGTEFNLCEDGSYSDWVGCDAVLPSYESCDGLDNDCDGQVDEDLVVEQPCGLTDTGVCTIGVEAMFCINGQYSPWLTCDAVLPSDEICDGLDNDCDGEADEAFVSLGQPCIVGAGGCQKSGIYVCSDNGLSYVCNAAPGNPAPEVCDGVDNDCDELVDEGLDMEQACGPSATGECSLGIEHRYCLDGAYSEWMGCSAVLPIPELCDALDNDCDGDADEDFEDLGTPCWDGIGACEGLGEFVCTEDGLSTICNAVKGDPAPEICDGLDNDCDGILDPGCCEPGDIDNEVPCPYQGHAFIFLIDNSGSMDTNDPSDIRYQGLHDLVDQLSPDDEGTVIAFDSTSQIQGPFTSDHDVLHAQISSAQLFGGGGTSIGDAITNVAIPEFESTALTPVLVLLTDGETGDSTTHPPAGIADAAEAAGVLVIAIGLGDDVDIQYLLSSSDGRLVLVDMPESIPGLYNEIFYAISYQSWDQCSPEQVWEFHEGQCENGVGDPANSDLFWKDLDSDGFASNYGLIDCDDLDPLIWPGSIETCDGKDNDCDGGKDEDGICPTCTQDADCDIDSACIEFLCGADDICDLNPIPGCCTTNTQCDDGDTCTLDKCQGNVCVHQDQCCLDDSECDDGDDICTDDSCVGGFCQFLPTGAAGCCLPEVWHDTFENSIDDWMVTGTTGDFSWHASQARAVSGSFSLAYSNSAGNDYNDSAFATALSPPIELPNQSEVTLVFQLWYQIESCCDDLDLFIITDAGDVLLENWAGTSEAFWQEVSIDVTEWANQAVQFRFEFDSDGSVSFDGVFIDDFSITQECCTLDTDCDDGDPCTMDTCPGPNSQCTFELVAECCITDMDCDDGDSCTEDSCPVSGGACQNLYVCCSTDDDCNDGDDICTDDLCVNDYCQFIPTGVAGCCEPGNLAALPGTVATSSGGGSGDNGPANMIDVWGETDCSPHKGHWLGAGNTPNGEWIQLEWSSIVIINQMSFDTMNAAAGSCIYGSGRALSGGDVQYWDGAAWVTVGTVAGNIDDWQYIFPAPVSTTRLRLYNAHASSTGGQQSNPVIYDWQVSCQ